MSTDRELLELAAKASGRNTYGKGKGKSASIKLLGLEIV